MIETDPGLRLAMAELLRQELEAGAPVVRRVTGYQPDIETHWAGMSSEYTTVVVNIHYEDYAGEPQAYRYEGDFGLLVRRLSDVVENY